MFVIFMCTFFIYRDFSIRMIFGYAILCVILGLNILKQLFSKTRLELSAPKIVFCSFCAFVFISFIRPGARFDEDTVSYIIAMFISLGYFIFMRPQKREFILCARIITATAFAFGVVIIFFRIFPTLYWGSIYTVLSDASREIAYCYIYRGYGIPIGGSYTFADYVIITASFICIGMLIAGYGDKKQKIIAACLCVFYLFSVFFVGRRGELLCMLAAVFFAFVLFSGFFKSKKRVLISLGGVVAAVGAFIIAMPVLEKISVFKRYIWTFENLLSGGADVTSGRLELWAKAIELFLKHPIFGMGWGSYASYVSDEFRAVHGADVTDVHNTVLQLMCETGVVGTVIFIGCCLFLLVSAIIIAYKAKAQNDTYSFVLCVVSAQIQMYFAFLGMMDPCHYKLIYWVFYVIAVLMLNIAAKRQNYVFCKRLTAYVQNHFKVKKLKKEEL